MGVTLKIDGLDVTSLCKTDHPTFNLPTKGERGLSTFTLEIPAASPYLPTDDDYNALAGKSVEWLDDGVSVWLGTIDNWVRRPIGTSGWSRLSVTAVTLEQKFDTIRVTRAFAAGSTAGAIVADILATEAAGLGISTGSIQAGVTLDKPKVFEFARATDVITDLARLSDDYISYVQNAALYFEPRTTVAAPVSITGAADILAAKNPEVSLDRSEYRNRQTVKISEANLVLERETFQGDGNTSVFTLSKSIREIVSVTLTTDTPLEIIGTFNSVPVDGDAIQIGGWAYTFKTVLPDTSSLGFFQTAQNYVQIGRGNLGTILEDTILNLIACVLDTGEGKGSYYSSTAIKNSFVDGAVGAATTITITTGTGAYSNTGSFKSYTGAFAWGTPTNAEDGASDPQTVVESGNAGVADFDWTYDAGGTTLTLGPDRDPPAADQKVVVEYKPIGFGFVTVDAPAEIAAHGLYHHLAYAEDKILTLEEGLAYAAALLRANSAFPRRIRFETRQHLLRPGQMVSVFSQKLGVDVTYLIASVDGVAIGPNHFNQHFRYKILAVNGTQTYLEFWAGLVNKGSRAGGGGSGSGSGVSTQQAKAAKSSDQIGWYANFKIDDDTTAGDNVTGSFVPITAEGKPYIGRVTVVRRADAGNVDTIYDVKYSPDNEANWYSLFATGDQNKIVIKAAIGDQDVYLDQNPRQMKIENFRSVNLKPGWILRLDRIQGGGAVGLSFWIHGKPAGKTGSSSQIGPGVALIAAAA